MLYFIGAIIISLCVGTWHGAIWGFFVLGCFCLVVAFLEYLGDHINTVADGKARGLDR